jgi:hypothetical protein
VTTALSVFLSTGIWPVNRTVFQDHCLFPCVANTSRAEFVQPIQAEFQDKTGISQVPSHRTINGKTSLLVKKKPVCQKLILPAVLTGSTVTKCLKRQLN